MRSWRRFSLVSSNVSTCFASSSRVISGFFGSSGFISRSAGTGFSSPGIPSSSFRNSLSFSSLGPVSVSPRTPCLASSSNHSAPARLTLSILFSM